MSQSLTVVAGKLAKHLAAQNLVPPGIPTMVVSAFGIIDHQGRQVVAVTAAGAITFPVLGVTAAGDTTVTGTLVVTSTTAFGGNITVNTDKFTIAAASGNTAIAGTLAVTGASTLTGNVTASGTLAVTGAVTLSSTLAVTGAITATAGVKEAVTTISGDGAVTIASGTVVLTKGSAAAITVAAPSSQDGTKIRIISNSDFAHVVTFTGSTLLDGTTGANLTVTMTAFKGSAIEVVAVGTKWLLVSSSNVTSITA